MKKRNKKNVGVIIPAFRVKNHILDVIKSIGPEVNRIFVVDDFCPENSGQYVEDNIKDDRVLVLYHSKNQGVGGAVKTGYQQCIKENISIAIKIDGDGQMDPKLIPKFIEPLLEYEADYVKGNRFFNSKSFTNMPKIRIIGNVILSFFSKISSGYWNIFDPNNGFTAINTALLQHLDFDKIEDRYFFESDFLYHLNLLRAKIIDIPIYSVYGEETSNLSILKSTVEFPLKHSRNFLRRILNFYFYRDFSTASLQLFFGTVLTLVGSYLALFNYYSSQIKDIETPTGTLILITLMILVGVQFLLSFLSYDIQSVPKSSISRNLESFENYPEGKWDNR
jgi:glycosyltransferase involved in cell wall biosynthesis